MSTPWREPARETPVIGEFDIVVGGGGPAGCAAAIAAARHGMRTCLVEQYGYLGGATVSQLVAAVLSMNGVDFQGIWHEWIRRLRDLGGVGDLAARRGRLVDGSVDPELVKRAWDELADEAGVVLLHHALVAGAMVEDGRACGVIVETRAGRQALRARRTIDCTGDGRLCHAAGVPWEQGSGETVYAMACTTSFRLGNAHRPAGFPTHEHLRKIETDYVEAMASGRYRSPMITQGRILNYLRAWTRPLACRPEILVTGTSRVLGVNPLDPWDLTRAEREGRGQAWDAADYYMRYMPGCEEAYLVDTSAHIGVRSTRRIQGIERVTREDVINFRKRKDGIARSSWHVDIWPHDSYTTGANAYPNQEWMARLRGGDWFDIPYGCLVASGVDNLLMAGRCISADHWAQSSLRIQQTCMSTGQAAGTAAALSLQEDVTPRELDSPRLVAQLDEDRDVEPALAVLRDRQGRH